MAVRTQAPATKAMRFVLLETTDGARTIADIVEIEMPDPLDANSVARFRRLRNKLIEQYTDRLLTGEISDYQTLVVDL